jgi:hypothetical protein
MSEVPPGWAPLPARERERRQPPPSPGARDFTDGLSAAGASFFSSASAANRAGSRDALVFP